MPKKFVLIAGLAITVGVAVWAATYHVYLGHTGFGFMMVFYLAVAGMVIFYMLSALLSGNFAKLPRAEGHITAIITTYNEPTEALHSTIWALIDSVRPPDIIHVMDDGSMVPAETFDHPKVVWHRQANMGKRHAQANVLRQLDANATDFILTIDSDSIVDQYAVDQLLRAFSRPEVQGATGLILVRNWQDNVLTRAQDLDIGTSCLLVRTSRSVLGAVSPTSGAMAMYRKEILFDNLDDYVSSGTNGDDRRLSLYSLLRGKVVAVNSAMVHSAMPTGAKDLFKQRLRWGKSGWQSLPFEIINLSFIPLAFRLYALTLAILLPIMYGWVGISVVRGGHYSVIGIAVAAGMVIRYGETSLYAMIRPGMTTWQRLWTWAVMTPVAFLMNWFVIRPAKYWALTKLKARGWETRGNAHALGRVYKSRRLARQIVVLRLAGAAVVVGFAVIGVSYWSMTEGRHIDPVAPIAARVPMLADPAPRKPYVPPVVTPSAKPKQEVTQQPVPQLRRTTAATPDRTVPRRTPTASRTPTPTRSTPTPVPTRIRPPGTPSRPVPRPSVSKPSQPPSSPPTSTSPSPSIPPSDPPIIVIPPVPGFSAPIIVPSS